jgi:protein-S-isoprenylcysteine O-methyltransferase Ste14
MFSPLIIEILLAVGFLLFSFTQIFAVVNKKHALKNAPEPANTQQKSTMGQYRIISRMGNIAGDLLGIFVILNIFFFNFISRYIPHLNLAAFSTPIRLIAFVSILLGCGIMFVSYQTLGANWIDSVQKDGRIALPEEQKLVKSGIYAKIRNPIYLATSLVFGGFAFLTLDVLLILLFVIHSLGVYFQVLDEEKALLDHFGSQYTHYLQTAGRFFPRWKK